MRALFCAALLLLTLSACSGPIDAAPTPTPSLASPATPAPTPTATPLPTPTPTPEPQNRSQTSGRVIPEGTPSRPFILSIDNAAGAQPQTSLMEADIVYEFLVEGSITRFQAVYNDAYPLYAGPLRSARYYFIDLAQEWDCMYLHRGYVLLEKPYRRSPSKLITLYLPGEDFPGYSASFYRSKGAYDDFEAKNGYFFRATESGRGSVHALYTRVAALVERYYGEHEAKICERFSFMENASRERGTPFTNVSLSFGTSNPGWIAFAYDAASNRLLRSEGGAAFMTRTLTDHGDSYTTEQLSVQNLIVQYCAYGGIKGDTKHRRSCELIGSGKCDYFVNGLHTSGSWSRPTAEDYTSYLLDDGSLLCLEPGSTWIAVHPDDAPVLVE